MEPSVVRTAGANVIGDGGTVAMVKSENSKSWLFPKGRVEAGEDDEAAARREIEEEAGLADLEYLDDLGEFTRPRVSFEAGSYDEKAIHMFLFAAKPHAAIAPRMEIREARWVPYREAPDLLGTPHAEWFVRDRAWFASVFERVRQAIQRD